MTENYSVPHRHFIDIDMKRMKVLLPIIFHQLKINYIEQLRTLKKTVAVLFWGHLYDCMISGCILNEYVHGQQGPLWVWASVIDVCP